MLLKTLDKTNISANESFKITEKREVESDRERKRASDTDTDKERVQVEWKETVLIKAEGE